MVQPNPEALVASTCYARKLVIELENASDYKAAGMTESANESVSRAQTQLMLLTHELRRVLPRNWVEEAKQIP